MAEMKSPNAHAKKNRNDTPRKRKTHIIKVRVTAEEKLRIAYWPRPRCPPTAIPPTTLRTAPTS